MSSSYVVQRLQSEISQLVAERELMLVDMSALEDACQSLSDDCKKKDERIESLLRSLNEYGINLDKLSFTSPMITTPESDSRDPPCGDSFLRSSFL